MKAPKRKSGQRWDKTRNTKHTRLLITWPGRTPIQREIRGHKELRAAIDKYTAAGATVTEQAPTEWGAYRTVRTHQPEQIKEPAA